MISFFRRALSSWVVLGLLGLLVIAFIVTGVAPRGSFGGDSGAATGESIATVGRTKIGSDQASRQAQNMLNVARQQQPTLDMAGFVRMGGVEQLVAQMTTGEALKMFGVQQGLSASKRLIDAEIASIPAFQLAGKFDQKTYEGVLAQQHLTDRQIREGMEGDLVRRQLLVPLAGAIAAPRKLIEPYAALLLEERQGEVGIIPSQLLAQGMAAPSPAEVDAFYKRNLARFTLPERRVLRYAALDPAVAVSSKPSDAEIAKYYQDNAATYAATAKRKLAQVILKSQADAQKLAAAVRAGGDFTKLAAAAGFSAADIELGEQGQAEFAGASSTDVARAAFATPVGKVSDPVQSDFGWHVIRVESETVKPGRTLAAARDEIAAALQKQKSEDALSDLVAKLEDAISGGQNFNDVVKAHKLQAVVTPPITASGQNPDDSAYKPDATVNGLLKPAFQFGQGDPAAIEQVGTNFVLLDVQQVVAPAPVPLAKIAPVVTAALQAERANTRAKAVATEVLAKVKAGTPLATALAAAKMPAPQKAGARRLQLAQAGQQVPPPLAMLFTLPEGGANLIAAPNDAGWMIVKLDSIKRGDAATMPSLVEGTQSQFSRNMGEEIAAQFARATADEIGVKRNPAAIARLKKQLSGAGAAAE